MKLAIIITTTLLAGLAASPMTPNLMGNTIINRIADSNSRVVLKKMEQYCFGNIVYRDLDTCSLYLDKWGSPY